MPKFIMSRIVLLAIFIYFFDLSASGAMDWKGLHNQADNLSLAAAREMAAKNLASPSKQYVLGLVYLNLHQDQAADEIFSRLLADDPGLIELNWGKAELLRRRHDSLAAENLLNTVIKSDPQFARALISLAYIKYY